jgi:nucleoside-diphosphate-sugar epimerase
VKVVVTGGAGFIGSHLVDRLLLDGHEVRVLDNFATGRRENLVERLDDIELIEGDIQSYERAHTAVRGTEVVLHQAALPSVPRSVQDPLTSNASNVIGTLNVLLAARDSGVGRVVYASSSSVYGSNPVLPKHEELAPLPISPYAVTKLAGEGYARSFHEVYGLESVTLRYFNVFGPRQDPTSQYAAAIPNFMNAFLADERPRVFGDGNQTRDFTPVENVVEANMLAIACPRADGRVYNVACGEQVSVNRVLEQLRSLTGKNIQATYEEPLPGQVRDSLADLSRAEHELGYRPLVSFETGLERTLEHFRERWAARSTDGVRAVKGGTMSAHG